MLFIPKNLSPRRRGLAKSFFAGISLCCQRGGLLIFLYFFFRALLSKRRFVIQGLGLCRQRGRLLLLFVPPGPIIPTWLRLDIPYMLHYPTMRTTGNLSGGQNWGVISMSYSYSYCCYAFTTSIMFSASTMVFFRSSRIHTVIAAILQCEGINKHQ